MNDVVNCSIGSTPIASLPPKIETSNGSVGWRPIPRFNTRSLIGAWSHTESPPAPLCSSSRTAPTHASNSDARLAFAFGLAPAPVL